MLNTAMNFSSAEIIPECGNKDCSFRDAHCENERCAICLENIAVNFGTHTQALKNVNLRIGRGEHVALMGISGSGKTTLLRCIAKRIKPCQGQIESCGNIANIYQDRHVVLQQTALENVLHGSLNRYGLLRTLVSFPRQEKEKAIGLLKRVGLKGKENNIVAKLSGGERQRVSIARALMQDPDIILADEPAAALDEVNAHGVMRLITSIAHERNLTVVSVLHDRELAEYFTDRQIYLSNGKLEDLPTHLKGMPKQSRMELLEKEHQKNLEENASIIAPKYYRTITKFAGFGILCIMIGLALAFCGIETRDTEGAFGNLINFISALFPSSIAEIAKIPWNTLVLSLFETINMAFLGTIFGIAIAWPLSALAARNCTPTYLGRPIRLVLNFIRTVPSLIWALLFVAAVGLGPFAGILALIAYSVGYLSKFYYEAFEAVNPGTPSALQDIGASRLQTFWHAIWPASRPAILSSSVFMLEYNVRAASILGVVDAGGIGFYIKQYIDFRYFPAVTASLLLILAVVLVLDTFSSRLRRWLTEAYAVVP